MHARYISAYRETFESGVNYLKENEGIPCAALALFDKTLGGTPFAAALAAVRRLGYGDELLESLSDREAAFKTG